MIHYYTTEKHQSLSELSNRYDIYSPYRIFNIHGADIIYKNRHGIISIFQIYYPLNDNVLSEINSQVDRH